MVGWLLDHGASPGALALRAIPSARHGGIRQNTARLCGHRRRLGARRTRLAFSISWRTRTSILHGFTRRPACCSRRGPSSRPAPPWPSATARPCCGCIAKAGSRTRSTIFRGGLLAIAVRVNRLDMVATLLDLGLDPDEPVVTDDGDRSWGMPLWFASMCGRHEIAELLLARGADVNAIVYACGDALGHAPRRADEGPAAQAWRAHSRSNSFRAASRAEKLAKAILDGTMPGYSLDVANPTLTDLAEQMLWAAGRPRNRAHVPAPHARGRATIPGGITSWSTPGVPDKFQAHPGPRGRSRRSRRRRDIRSCTTSRRITAERQRETASSGRRCCWMPARR